jgi:hypothetical protein
MLVGDVGEMWIQGEVGVGYARRETSVGFDASNGKY